MTKARSNAVAAAAKGDLTVGTGTNLSGILPVGADNSILVADSSTPTGLAFAAPAGASFVGCRLFQSSGQSVANGSNVTLNFGSESFDTDAFHSTSSNTSRITIPAGKNGKYLFIFNFVIGANASGKREMKIMKNGSTASFGNGAPPSTDEFGGTLTLVDDAVATDYYEVLVFQSSGSTLTTVSGAAYTQFTAIYLGA